MNDNQKIDLDVSTNQFSKTDDSSREKVYVENNEKENLSTEIKKNKKKKNNRWKRFFYGIGKEFGRISWIKKKEIATSFAIVLAVVIFFSLIFWGISILMTQV